MHSDAAKLFDECLVIRFASFSTWHHHSSFCFTSICSYFIGFVPLVLYCALISVYLYFLLCVYRHLLSLGNTTSICFSSAPNSWLLFSQPFASSRLTILYFPRTPLSRVFSNPAKCFGNFSSLCDCQMALQTYAASNNTYSFGCNFASPKTSAASHISRREPHTTCIFSNTLIAV